MNSLIALKEVPGYFNYTRPAQQLEKSFQLVQVEQIEDAIFAPLAGAETSFNLCSSCKRNLKSDLPLTSDFGEINSPYELIYARLEGLQHRSG